MLGSSLIELSRFAGFERSIRPESTGYISFKEIGKPQLETTRSESGFYNTTVTNHEIRSRHVYPAGDCPRRAHHGHTTTRAQDPLPSWNDGLAKQAIVSRVQPARPATARVAANSARSPPRQ